MKNLYMPSKLNALLFVFCIFTNVLHAAPAMVNINVTNNNLIVGNNLDNYLNINNSDPYISQFDSIVWKIIPQSTKTDTLIKTSDPFTGPDYTVLYPGINNIIVNVYYQGNNTYTGNTSIYINDGININPNNYNNSCPIQTVNINNQSWNNYSWDTEKYKNKWVFTNQQTQQKYFDYNFYPNIQLPRGEYNALYQILYAPDSLIIIAERPFPMHVGNFVHINTSTGSVACNNQNVKFNINGIGSMSNIIWHFSPTDSVMVNNGQDWFNRSFPNNGVYNIYTSFYNNECGIYDKLYYKLTVSNSTPPAPEFHSNFGNQFCPTENIEFYAHGDYKNYKWEFGDGTTDTTRNTIHKYNSIGKKAVKLTVTSMCGTTGSRTDTIFIQNNVPVNAQFNYNIQSNNRCKVPPVEFNAQCAGKYFWNFGDGSTDTTANPVHNYKNIGEYNVVLTVINACDSSSSQTNTINIYEGNSTINDIKFDFDFGNNENNLREGESLKICPMLEVKLQNKVWLQNNEQLSYIWSFGDGTTSNKPNPTHIYTTEGIYTINLAVVNNCGGSGQNDDYNKKVVEVRTDISPTTILSVAPRTICAGEKLYFFNEKNRENNSYNNQQYKFFIDFGDGFTKNWFDSIENSDLKVLATHKYTNTGTYKVKFISKNTCGKTDTLNKTIIVGDSQAAPFYYLENSTAQRSDGPTDLSVRQSPSDHKFDIPVRWLYWKPSMDSTFFIYFVKGKSVFDREPIGRVKFKAKDIRKGQIVTAYVPDPINEDNLGIIFAYYNYSYQSRKSGMPQYLSEPVARNLELINAFPYISGGYTNLAAIVKGGFLELPQYNNGEAVQPAFVGDWTYSENNSVVSLSFEKSDMGNYSYTVRKQNNNSDYYDQGMASFSEHDSIITFENSSNCHQQTQPSAKYKLINTQGKLQLSIYNNTPDYCTERQANINNKTFMLQPDNIKFDTVQCAGDSIIFKIAGGKSYEFIFGDGQKLITQKSLNKHKYLNSGTYNVQVLATNACNRTDTLVTKVVVGTKAMLKADFGINGSSNIEVNKPFQLWPFVNNDTSLYMHSWDFGDGSTSNLAAPIHTYTQAGKYIIKHTIASACNSQTTTREFLVQPLFITPCIAKIAMQQVGNVYKFDAIASPNASSFKWINTTDSTILGTSTLQNIQLNYLQNKQVKLIVTLTNGSVCESEIKDITAYDSIAAKAEIGNANYSFNSEQNQRMLNVTTGSCIGNKLVWDFGDGSTSENNNETHYYKTDGNYTLKLTAFNTLSGDSQVVGQAVNVYSCNANFTVEYLSPDSIKFTATDANADKFIWYNSSETFKSDTTIKFNYGGNYYFNLQITDTATGCTANASQNIIIEKADNCWANILWLQPKFDSNEIKFSLETSGISNVDSCIWNFGDTTTGNGAIVFHTYAKSGEYYVEAQVFGKLCTFTTGQYIRATGQCAEPVFFAEVVEGKNEIIITNLTQGAANTAQYTWDFGDGTYSNLANPKNHIYSNTGNYNISLSIFDNVNLCNNYYYFNIQVGQSDCYAYFNFEKAQADTVNFIDGSFNASKYLWRFGDGTFSNLTAPSKLYNKSGSYEVCLTITNNNGSCQNKYCQNVLAGEIKCKADFAYTIDTLTGKIFMRNLSSGASEMYWSFGDGKYATDMNPDNTYDNAGQYNVSLSVYNPDFQCSDYIEKQILVNKPGQKAGYAYFSYYVTDNKVQFNNLSTNNFTKQVWTFGDGKYGTENTETHQYSKPGFYKVCIKVIDNTNNLTDQYCEDIMVGEVTCNVVAQYNYIVNNQQVRFTNKSTGSADNFYWDFGDGTTSADENPLHDYTKPGLYMVSLSVKKQVGWCSDAYTDFVLVGTVNCTAGFEYYADPATGNVSFKNNSKGDNLQFYWYFGDGEYATDASPTHSFKKGSINNVGLSVADPNGLCWDYTEAQVQVGEINCSAAFSYYVDSVQKAYCLNQSKGDGTKYFWTFGDGDYSEDTNPSHKYTTQGYYPISLTTFNNAGCVDNVEKIVLIGNAGSDCEANFMYKADISNSTLNFFDQSNGNIESHLWDFGDSKTNANYTSTQPSPSHTYTKSGYYNVCLTVTNSVNISNISCKTVWVGNTDQFKCEAKFATAIDVATNTIQFTDQSTGSPNNWEWEFENSGKSNSQNPSKVFPDTGLYIIGLRVSNSVSGCESYTYKMVNLGGQKVYRHKFVAIADTANQQKATGYPVDFVGVGMGDNARLKWDFGDNSTNESSNNPTHVYEQPGTYNVCYTVSDPITAEESKFCNPVTVVDKNTNPPTNIASITNNNMLTITPNPVNDYLNLLFNSQAGINKISITDIAGRTIYNIQQVTENNGLQSSKLKANNWQSGSYIVTIATSNGNVYKKVFIKK